MFSCFAIFCFVVFTVNKMNIIIFNRNRLHWPVLYDLLRNKKRLIFGPSCGQGIIAEGNCVLNTGNGGSQAESLFPGS